MGNNRRPEIDAPEAPKARKVSAGGLVEDAYNVQTLALYGRGFDSGRVIKVDAPATPAEGDKIKWTKHADGTETADIDHKKQFGYTLRLTKKNGSLTKVVTDYDEGGNNPPDRTYEKTDGKWYQIRGDKKIPMQGELVANDDGSFRQVMRTDLDGEAGKRVVESSRVMKKDGTVIATRSDGSRSEFTYDEKGKPVGWTEYDKDGKTKLWESKAEMQQGQLVYVSTDGKNTKRWNASIEDNMNVTWADDPRGTDTAGRIVDPLKRHVLTSAGDHMVDGDGAKYSFNDRGDVTSIRFVDKDGNPRVRRIDGYDVDRIDMTYRDGESRIIDRLAMSRGGQWVGFIEREKSDKANEAKNTWLTFDGNHHQIFQTELNQQRQRVWKQRNGHYVPALAYGDYAIQNGELQTTDPNFAKDGRGNFVEDADGRLTMADGHVTKTYKNDPELDQTHQVTTVKEDKDKNLDIPVMGEASFGTADSSTKPGGGPSEPGGSGAESPMRNRVSFQVSESEMDELKQLFTEARIEPGAVMQFLRDNPGASLNAVKEWLRQQVRLRNEESTRA
jgi:YD repeat-containing protein